MDRLARALGEPALNVERPAVVTATPLEAANARKELPGWRVVCAGMALAHGHPEGDALISCGLAGGLGDRFQTGAVVIPREVRRPDGSVLLCDDALTQRLIAGARRLGLEPVVEPLLTAPGVVTGAERARWWAQGYAAADMETGLLRAPRVAAVRVILDTPSRELSPAWLHPARALLDPRNWPQALWLARDSPRCARLAARVIAGAWST
ncbi:MAG TPA: hypothetical protein VMH02_13260 [Verrucomicrobiae bacterium]|nr:hypothetical protein [Verrucomicrobiae bacterium]